MIYEKSPAMLDRIRKGMALLDEKKPGWRDKIDCDTLALEDPQQCVLGQVYADEVSPGSWSSGFGIGIGQLGLGYPYDYGFDVFSDEKGADSYIALNEAWKEELDCKEVSTDGADG